MWQGILASHPRWPGRSPLTNLSPTRDAGRMRASRTRTSTKGNPAATTKSFVNRVLITLLNSGAGRLLGRRLAVVEYRGRSTGQQHRLVAAYVAEGHSVRFAVGMADHKTWWRNFQTPHPLRLRLAGASYDAVGHVVQAGRQVGVVAELMAFEDPHDPAGTSGPNPSPW